MIASDVIHIGYSVSRYCLIKKLLPNVGCWKVLTIKKNILWLVAYFLIHKTSVECEEDEEAPYLELIYGQA